MKKFQEALMKDLGWKLLSIGIATIMWFMVININQPVDTRTYSKYITLDNMEVLTDRGLTARNAEDIAATKVNIKIKAQRTSLDRLNQSNDWLQVSVDFSGLQNATAGDTVSLPVKVEMLGGYSGYTIVSKAPANIQVSIERLASKELPIEITLNGELSKNALYSAPVLSADTVWVKGPASAVERVTAVRGVINAQDVQGDVQLNAKLVPYDSHGTQVKGVKLGTSDVTVIYGALGLKSIPIKVNISGTPGDGFELGETTCTPQTIEVVANPEILKDFIYLQLPDIDISGSSSTQRKSFAVADYLPEGIAIKDGSSPTIQVNVQVLAANSREIVVRSNQLTVLKGESGMSYEISGSAKVVITGEETLINNIDESTLTGTVDVSGLSVGHHKVPIALNLADGITAGYAYIDVAISQEGDASDSES